MGFYQDAWNIFLAGCGLSCVTKDQSFHGIASYRVTRWKFLVSGGIIAAICVVVYFMALEIPQIHTEKGKTLVTNYLTITGNMVAVIIIFCAAISSSKYASIKERFTLYDSMIYIDYKALSHSISKYAAVFLTIFVFSFITDLMAFVKDDSSGSFLKMISSFIFQFYNLLTILHFSVCLFWLRKSFALINGDLVKHSQESQRSVKEDVNKIFRQNVIHPDAQKDFLRIQIVEKEKEKCNGLERMRFLRSVYHVAFELARDVNGVFATRNVVSVGYNFVIGTIFVYSGISELVRRTRGDSDVTMLELIILFKSSFISFLSIYGLVWPSVSTCNEAKRTPIIIQGILTNSLRDEIRMELLSASYQFANEQVSFSPHGFFTLNNSLLLSIMGAVVSYLVVLIQFRISMV